MSNGLARGAAISNDAVDCRQTVKLVIVETSTPEAIQADIGLTAELANRPPRSESAN
jgi:ribosomal protein L30E